MLKICKELIVWPKTPFMFPFLFLSFLLSSSVLSCATPENELDDVYGRGPYPYVFKEAFGTGGTMLKSYLVVSDVDCDQRDEFLYLAPGSNVRNRVELWDEHIDVKSWVLNFSNELGKPFCANLDGKGDLEIVIPEKIGDSIFVTVYTSERQQLQRFFACEGVDRNSSGHWDGQLIPRIACDLSGDGVLEIVAAVNSAHDLHPRGVWAFDWVEEKNLEIRNRDSISRYNIRGPERRRSLRDHLFNLGSMQR
jgi:hypothetical protein